MIFIGKIQCPIFQQSTCELNPDNCIEFSSTPTQERSRNVEF